MNELEIALIVDRRYLDPLTTTLWSLLNSNIASDLTRITVVYNLIEAEDERYIGPFTQIISKFIELSNQKLRAFRFERGPFDSFNRLHFNATILNKLLLPESINSESNILFIVDAGLVVGRQIKPFVEECRLKANRPIAAFTSPKENSFGEIREYPAGVILMINVQAYKDAGITNRLISYFREYHSTLLYGEQDLLFEVLHPTELTSFESRYVKIHFDLATFSRWDEINDLTDLVNKQDYLYWKYVGSAKPWLYGIKNPIAAHYFNAQASLPNELQQILENVRFNQKTDALNPAFDLMRNQDAIFKSYLKHSFRLG